MAKSEAVKLKILNYIRKNDCVSYVEIERIFEHCDFDYKGELVICSRECENVVFWVNWNQEAIDLINDLKRDGLIYQDIAHPFVYLVDGKGLNMPQVKRKMQYKTEHWLPLVFKIGKKGVKL